MKKSITAIKLLLINLSLLFFLLSKVKAQNIGINGTGANAHSSALLDVDDAGTNTKGLLIPRIPLTAINVATPVTSPATSLLVYNTASASTGTNAITPGYYYWDGIKWVRFAYSASGSSANDWNTLGNAGTNPTANFLGTTDAQDLVFRTNNLEAVRITTVGNVGIGTPTPFAAKLYINSTTGNALYVSSPNDGYAMLTKGYNTGLLGNPTTAGWELRSNDNTTPFSLNQPNALTFEFWNGLTYTNSTTFLPNGKVGIGTLNPSNRLTIVTDNSTDNSNDDVLIQSAGITTPAYKIARVGGTILTPTPLTTNNFIGYSSIAQAYNGSALQDVSYIGSITETNHSATDLTSGIAFGTTNSLLTAERMRIAGNGNVGIGTSTPVYPLHVVLPDNGSLNGIRFEGLRSIAGGHTVRLELMGVNSPATVNKKNFQITNTTPSDGSQNRLLFTSVNDAQTTLSNYLLTLEHDGNVGIGTPTPSYKLDVTGAVNPSILVGTGGFGTGGALLLGNPQHGIIRGAGSAALGFTPTPNDVTVYTTSANLYLGTGPALATPRITIDQTGLVGIGTTNPTSQLHVVGVGNPLFNNGLTIQSPNANQALDILPGFALTNSTAAGVQENLTMTLRSSGSSFGNMAFATGNEERMRINTLGNVGIGTTSPSQKLHLNEGYLLIDNTALTETALLLSNNNTGVNSSSYISFRNQAGNTWINYMGGPTGYAGVLPNAMEWWEYPFSQSGNAGTCCLARFRISPNNTGTGYATVVIDGAGQMFGNGWAQPSDRTLKTNIKSLTNALDKISKLGGYSYNFTKESGLDDGKVHIGVIAQEVEAVLPEAVSQYPQANYKAINYDALIPLQIEAFKELIQENKQQQNQIDALLKRIEQLEKKN